MHTYQTPFSTESQSDIDLRQKNMHLLASKSNTTFLQSLKNPNIAQEKLIKIYKTAQINQMLEFKKKMCNQFALKSRK